MTAVSRVLRPSGTLAELRPDPLRPGAFELSLDGVLQSHVDLADPAALRFDYVRRIANAIDRMQRPGLPVTALHLGGGALTLPRYLQATRAGSEQHVVELEADLLAFVGERLPLPPGTSLTAHAGDAAVEVPRLADEFAGAFDLVVCDLYVGLSTPAPVRSARFYSAVAILLAPEALLAINVADDDGLPALREQISVLRPLFPSLLVLGESAVLVDGRAGNAVVLASFDPALPALAGPLLAAGPHPAASLTGDAPLFTETLTADAPLASATSEPTRKEGTPCAADSP